MAQSTLPAPPELAQAPPVDAPTIGVRALWPYLRRHRPTLVLVVALSLLSAAAALATPLLTQRFIDDLGAGEAIASTLALLVAAVLIGSVLDGLITYLLSRTAGGVVLDTRVRLVDRLLRLPVAELDRRRVGDLISRVGADTTLLSAVVTSGLVQLVAGLVVIVGAIVLMARLDALLLLLTLVATGVGVAAVGIVSTRLRPLSEQAQAAVGAMTAGVERVLGAVRTVRAARAERRESAAIAAQAHAAYRAGLRVARVQAAIEPLAGIAIQGAFLAVLGAGGASVATGRISLGELIAFVLLLFLLVQPLAGAIMAWTSIQTGLGALARIEEVLALPPEDVGDPTAQPTPVVGAPLLELRDVHFAHADGTVALRGVDLVVARGMKVALVGPSGAGKSTLLGLVERFHDVSAGSLLVEGVDVRDWPRDALRARIGYVEQEAAVLAGTIRDNLLLAVGEASDERLTELLATVNLTGIATRSPLGLDAPVGDGGVLLSGGERQRLALARTLLSAPDLLLLDEPTASLDAINEAALRRAIDAVAQERTLLVVAHRLSTVADADLIAVLDHGRLVASGTHAELVASSDLYRRFATEQLLA
ncbi:MAG: ABC transporter ATP-binding protein/permease [Candidatus Nanopelagicales bacterium]|jgi:ABC-type multidrug transport system fused ATPase/permease subunit|nr:ABC transporter ATP-binding protein/permease [Candidatus Nanopelagicales bacterium]